MLITLTGENSFALKQELNRITGNFVKDNSDLAVENLDGEEDSFEELSAVITSLSLFSRNRLVIIKQASKNKQFTEHFDHIIKDVSPDLDIVLVEPKLDKRLSYYKTAKKKTDFKEFSQLDQLQLAHWLVKAAKSGGGTISLDNAKKLVDRVGTDQQLVSNELNKLLLYQPDITAQTIVLLTEQIPQSTIFNLLEAAFKGQLERVFNLYREQRELNVEPQQIVAMLAWQLHILAIIKTSQEGHLEEIAREAKLNPYVLRKSQSIAQNLSLQKLKDLVDKLLAIDIKLKTKPVDSDEILQNYLLILAT
jgi:DNA polymerase-3 subunit delta